MLVHAPITVTESRGSYRIESAASTRQQPSGLRGDRGEDGLRRRRLGHERRHPPQRCLLVGDLAELGVQLGVVEGDGELAGDELDRVEPPGR